MRRQRQIWLVQIVPGDNILRVPEGAVMLSVGYESGLGILFVEVDTLAPTTTRRIVVRSTGIEYDTDSRGEFVGSYHEDGPFFLHVFDCGEE